MINDFDQSYIKHITLLFIYKIVKIKVDFIEIFWEAFIKKASDLNIHKYAMNPQTKPRNLALNSYFI